MSFLNNLLDTRRAIQTVRNNSPISGYLQNRTRQLPNDSGSYNTVAPTPNWGSPRIGATPPMYGPENPNVQQNLSTRTQQTNPATPSSPVRQQSTSNRGTTSPEDMALIANSIRAEQQRETGDIGSYAENAYADLNRLRNTQDDIATGVSDPYGWAGESGIPYSPQELNAIEKAMAGIYDPAIESAKAKYERAQRMDEMKYASDLRKEEIELESGLKDNNKSPQEMISLIDTQLSNKELVLEDIDRAIGLVSGGGVTGLTGSIGSAIPGTNAYNLKAKIDTIISNIGFDRLQQMKDASKTGGALGQVAVMELEMLQATMGSLKQAQSSEDLLYNLNRVKEQYKRTVQSLMAARNEASGSNYSNDIITTNDGLRWRVRPDGSYEQVSFNNAGSGAYNAQNIAQAIKNVESNGNYNARGASGEFGAYQFMPNTWKGWAKKYLGNENAPMTAHNQDFVALSKISELVNLGYNPQQIALIWNGGTPTVKKGINSKGVAYDSGAYANKVLEALNSLA